MEENKQTKKEKEKEKEERKFVNIFLDSPIGKKWIKKNRIHKSSLQKSEEPDFLFETEDNKIIGIEITKLIVPNENTKATQQLITIGNQVRTYFQNTYGFPISLIIDKYDKRKFSCKWSDHLDAAYHPGFCKIRSYQKIKEKLIDALDNNVENIKKNNFNFVKFYIEIENELFQITADAFINPFSGEYDVHVNNEQRCIENPFNHLQNAINKKNQKLTKYKEKCSECFLLIIIPEVKEGCSCHFYRLENYLFESKFKETFLLDLQSKKISSLKSTELHST